MEDLPLGYASAIEDFRRARRRAAVEQLLARLTGRSVDLLSYEEVRRKLRAIEEESRGVQDIPLDAIVGSVGRYTDFTRSFLPKFSEDESRWARVRLVASSATGFPPIEVYKIGDAYFVKDGNHRVSVARQLGATHIQAYVTEVKTRVPLTPDTDPDDLIIKAEYAQFLEKTRIDEIRPGADLTVTVPGQYKILEEHISVHRYFMGIEQNRPIPYEEAVAHWYDVVYMPVVRVIRELGILRDFPGRTETDLYIWLMEHRAALQSELGWEIPTEKAALDFVHRFGKRWRRPFRRLLNRLRDLIIPEALEDGPPPGQWRREEVIPRRKDRLFTVIVVAVNGREDGWRALEKAICIAQREEARIYGTYVVADGTDTSTVEQVRAEFERRCQEAGVVCSLAVEQAPIAIRLCERARWGDLLVAPMNHPPPLQIFGRLNSGLRQIIQRSPRPILLVPSEPSPMNRPLLAYDGSPKAREALFVATYIASRWSLPLAVVTVGKPNSAAEKTLDEARTYLSERGVQAEYILQDTPNVPRGILKAAKTWQADWILMGGYGHRPMLEIVLGSTVNHILQRWRKPTLICR